MSEVILIQISLEFQLTYGWSLEINDWSLDIKGWSLDISKVF